MKSLIGKLGMLALLATATSAVVAGCSSSQTAGAGHEAAEGPQGTVGLSLVPVSGVTLNSVHYVVTNSATPAVTVSEGDLPTPGTAKDFSFGLSLPVGTGYTISLSAASAETGDDITCGGSFGPFNVTPNSSTNFTLTLTCHDNTNGQVVGDVTVATDACPKIVFDYVVATPASANVGSTLAVAGKAHDLDGKTVTYAWKIANPAVGTFAPTTGATSTLTCNTQGLGTVVSVTASNGECSKALTTTVSCKSPLCGNGVIDPGETCDTALPAPCPSNCTYTCGNGIVEAPAEDCDPGNTATCDATCHFRKPVCGDGFITAPEVCDGTVLPAGSSPGATCSADCTTVIQPVCGDGIIQAGEQCDDKGPSPTCSNSCTLISTAACVTCENAGDCFESVNNCLGPEGGTPFTVAQQTECYSVMSCIEKTNCLDGTGTLGACYCGTLSTSACSAAPFDLTEPGAPNGPCAAVIQAGLPGVSTNTAVLGGLTATARPAGGAMQRLNCQKTANSSACLGTCGFTAGGPTFP
jgi:cysteine-rich repeat protein